MYWLWDEDSDGEPLLENIREDCIDNRLKHSPDEIIFEAELSTE